MNIASLDANQIKGLYEFIEPYVIEEDVADQIATLRLEILPTECQKKMAGHIVNCISENEYKIMTAPVSKRQKKIQ